MYNPSSGHPQQALLRHYNFCYNTLLISYLPTIWMGGSRTRYILLLCKHIHPGIWCGGHDHAGPDIESYTICMIHAMYCDFTRLGQSRKGQSRKWISAVSPHRPAWTETKSSKHWRYWESNQKRRIFVSDGSSVAIVYNEIQQRHHNSLTTPPAH